MQNALFVSLAQYILKLHTWFISNNLGIFCSIIFIMFFSIAVRTIFTLGVVKFLQLILFKQVVYNQDRYLKNMSFAISFLPIVLGIRYSLNLINVPVGWEYISRGFFKSLYIINFTWITYTFVDPIGFIFKKATLAEAHSTLLMWVIRISKFLIVLVGVSIFLEKWSVKVGTLITSLGIVGMAVALGAQDMFKNVISGIAIISERRFSVGDIIKVEKDDIDIEGVVETIGFRSTTIRKFDRTLLFLPNSMIADAPVINFSSRMYRRIYWNINLEYHATAAQLKYILTEIRKYLKDNPDFVQPPEGEQQIRLEQFGSSFIQVLIYCFASTNTWSKWLRIKEDFILKIKEIVEMSGASFALPGQAVYVEKTSTNLKITDLPVHLQKKMEKEEVEKAKAETKTVDPLSNILLQ